MALTTDIPCKISPEAAARLAELGIRQGFEQMLEHAARCVSDLRRLEVTLEPPYEEGEEPRVVINAAVGYRDGDPLNPGFQRWSEWVGRTTPPDISRHVTLLIWDEPIDER
jgi:hypothetical protein